MNVSHLTTKLITASCCLADKRQYLSCSALFATGANTSLFGKMPTCQWCVLASQCEFFELLQSDWYFPIQKMKRHLARIYPQVTMQTYTLVLAEEGVVWGRDYAY